MAVTKKEVFESPFIGIEVKNKKPVLYDVKGNYSVLIRMENPCVEYNGDVDVYYEYKNIFSNILKVLGDDYAIQKQDILSERAWEAPYVPDDYLMQRQFNHFNGRLHKYGQTVLVITGKINQSRFFSYDPRKFDLFLSNVDKVVNILQDKNMSCHIMTKKEVTDYLYRFFAMDFFDDASSLDNFSIKNNQLKIGTKKVQVVSLIDVEMVEMPNFIKPYNNETIVGRNFPRDGVHFLNKIPAETIIYNQVIHTVSQGQEKAKLEGKKKKHSSVPDPANNLCVEDINRAMEDIERNGQVLVYTHFDIIICSENDLDRAQNMIETNMLDLGIRISKQAYNQFELFRCAMPGNSYELRKYDLFLTSADVAVSLMYKECTPGNENSEFLLWVNDRQGVPLAIDPSDISVLTGRCQNRNKFILGPSGSGKSFFMNILSMQYLMQNTDIVMVDTGHSYSGLCEYFKGRYITYSEEKPITMNPFRISREEYNLEKVDFLVNLIVLLWKGTDGRISKVEERIIQVSIKEYYANYFAGIDKFTQEDKDRIREKMIEDWNKEEEHDDDASDLSSLNRKIDAFIRESEELYEKEKDNVIVKSLSFNTFFEFACERIPILSKEKNIHFAFDDFKFLLEGFYKGGDFETLLNDDLDVTLFDESFIVFEVDSIKENKILFPIVTLIIMDVFIQKMRLKANRKCLIIEEAWKAIASPLMANYILYLYKTVRKFFGEAMVVTQELDDIIHNEVVKNSIVANSDTVILLDQTKYKDNFSEVADILSLSEVEQNKIFTINNLDNKTGRSRFKEVYIKRGSWGDVYGLEVSPHQYFAFTTEKPEKVAVQIYETVFQNINTALDNFLDDLNNSGLALNVFISLINSNYLKQHTTKGIEHFNMKKNKLFSDYKDSGKSLNDFITQLNKKNQ